MPYPPGLSGYLTERGTLFYNGRTSEESFLSRFPFKGGVVLEADWNGKVLWEVRHPDHHHHRILLRNGNVLLNCMARVPDDIARRVKGGVEEDRFPSGQYAARPTDDVGKMFSDDLAEVTPAGQTVWEWRTWEHLGPVEDGIAEVQAPRALTAPRRSRGPRLRPPENDDAAADHADRGTPVDPERNVGAHDREPLREQLWRSRTDAQRDGPGHAPRALFGNLGGQGNQIPEPVRVARSI